MVQRIVRGTIWSEDEAEWSRWRVRTSETHCNKDVRYSGAEPWRHRYVSTASRNVIRSATRNQCRLWSIGVMWSLRRAANTRRAAAFWADWSLSSNCFGGPAQIPYSARTLTVLSFWTNNRSFFSLTHLTTLIMTSRFAIYKARRSEECSTGLAPHCSLCFDSYFSHPNFYLFFGEGMAQKYTSP